MDLVIWDQSFSVNVKQIDEQHQRLINMINEFNDYFSKGSSDEVLEKIIIGMAAYAREHFITEERYFDLFDYPDKEAHEEEHSKFFEKVAEFQTAFENKDKNLSQEIFNFLNYWWQNHIKVSDRQYADFFNKHGLF